MSARGAILGSYSNIRAHIPPHETHYTSQPTYHEWMDIVYGPVSEELPANMPSPRGRLVRTTTFFDANLMHDVVTGCSCTGVLHLLNQTPSSWFSSRQGQVETATYGSEFMAARQAVDQIIDIRYTLHMFGVPLDGPAWLLGDNQAVINSTTIPHSSLSKRWNALSYHHCHEAVAAGIVRFEFLPGHENPSELRIYHGLRPVFLLSPSSFGKAKLSPLAHLTRGE